MSLELTAALVDELRTEATKAITDIPDDVDADYAKRMTAIIVALCDGWELREAKAAERERARAEADRIACKVFAEQGALQARNKQLQEVTDAFREWCATESGTQEESDALYAATEALGRLQDQDAKSKG